MSAKRTLQDLDFLMTAFEKVGKCLGVFPESSRI